MEQRRCASSQAHRVELVQPLPVGSFLTGFAFGASRKPADDPGTGVEPVVLDVTDDHSVRTAIDLVVHQAGRLDVVVNNAGTTLLGALEETSTDEARWLLETNLLGVHRVTRAALPHLRAGKGHMIVMGSIAGFLAMPAEGFYSATKHALEGYAEVLRMEVAPFGVRVTLVEPGFVRTDFASNAHVVAAPLVIYEAMRRALAQGLAHDVQDGASRRRGRVREPDRRRPKLRHLVGRAPLRMRRLRPDARWHVRVGPAPTIRPREGSKRTMTALDRPDRPAHRALSAASIGAIAIGATAIGAVAIGALAVGRLVIGRLVVRRARIETLTIGHLTVDRLTIRESVNPPT
jgi:NAD(P)-dependent dehydrogenase (short-subunit alcohol dehydrogenase family)